MLALVLAELRRLRRLLRSGEHVQEDGTDCESKATNLQHRVAVVLPNWLVQITIRQYVVVLICDKRTYSFLTSPGAAGGDSLRGASPPLVLLAKRRPDAGRARNATPPGEVMAWEWRWPASDRIAVERAKVFILLVQIGRSIFACCVCN